MLTAAKILAAIAYAALVGLAFTFVHPIWHVGGVRSATLLAFLFAGVAARLFLKIAMYRDSVARGIVPPLDSNHSIRRVLTQI